MPSVLSANVPNVWPPFPGVSLRRGMMGGDVQLLQERLNELGANPRLSIDGRFGPLTEAAVITFQRANDLTPDGIVSPVTWDTTFGSNPVPFPKRMIALTFDDGPGNYTERLLDILERHGAQATFFVLGNIVETRRNTIKRISDIGSEVAGHTWTHLDMRQLSDQQIAEKIQSTSVAIESVVGFSPPIFRPPYGFTNSNVRRVSSEIGYSIILWTLDTLDWRYRDADIIYNTIMNNVEIGDNILLHDVYDTTVDAMERAIPSLLAEGFQLVTVSELLAYKYGELEPGMIYGRPRPITIQIISE